ILHWIGTGTLLFYAIGSAIMPKFVAGVLEHKLVSGRGISEFRILHGGFFMGLSLCALTLDNPLVYQAMGFAWISAAIVRLLAYLPDRPKINPSYLAFFAIEIGLGICLIL